MAVAFCRLYAGQVFCMPDVITIESYCARRKIADKWKDRPLFERRARAEFYGESQKNAFAKARADVKRQEREEAERKAAKRKAR
jgi:hypothetical protein